MCSLYIYTSRYLKGNFYVRCITFSLRTDIGKQKITFYATNCNTDKHGLEKPTRLPLE